MFFCFDFMSRFLLFWQLALMLCDCYLLLL